MAKYVFVIGSCFSGLGKGISTASLALLLKMRGLKVNICKFEGYYNSNAGCLSPTEHGETMVLADSTEVDLDLGSYFRIAGIELCKDNIVTNGMLYRELLDEHDAGVYLGQTIQHTVHYCRKIIDRFEKLGVGHDVVFVEIGGIAGDMEVAGYLESIRQFKQANPENVLVALIGPILYINSISEFKTKPLQNGVSTLQSFGIQPDIILCRTPGDPELPNEILEKVSSTTNVHKNSVFEIPDVKSVYVVPIEMWKRHIDDLIAEKLRLPRHAVRIHKYRDLVEKYVNADSMQEITIGVVNKYEKAEEAYVSLKEALYHAGVSNNIRVRRKWIKAEDIKNKSVAKNLLSDCDGIIVPGGFDQRGVEGKIQAIRYCRENKIPFLGICLGLQSAVIEFSRNVLGLTNVNSQEFDDKCEHQVVHFVEGQESIRKKSGTMRLGAFDCEVFPDTIAYSLYKKKLISERHRHRYEVNAAYQDRLEQAGFRVSGIHPQTGLIEIMELSKETHPFFLGTQCHPEFVSRLGSPAPLFQGLVAAAIEYQKTREAEVAPSNPL